MRNIDAYSNPFGDDKVIAACSIFGVMDTGGRRFSGDLVAKAISLMRERGNGLGGGFASYGIYPHHADSYALHVMLLNPSARADLEDFLRPRFLVQHAEPIPVRPTRTISDAPLLWRYFVTVDRSSLVTTEGIIAEADYVVNQVMAINTRLKDTFVFSSGKNMGVFKGVGFPEDIAEYYRLEEYEGYMWSAHGRFPTNTSAWWGGAHPFSLLDWTVVHNGEISSYGTNRRYLEMYGYHCTMHTDTEVIAYAVDLLVRKHGLPFEVAAAVLAPPLWSEIDMMLPESRELHTTLRQVYGSLLMNGPFTIIVCRDGEMVGLTDRIRLRPLTVASKGEMLFLSSEESAIRLVCPDVERAWIPAGGQPIIGRLRTGDKTRELASPLSPVAA